MTTKPTPAMRINITSVVSARTGEPLVNLEWGTENGQLDAAEAIAHAFKIIEAVEASYTDAFLVSFLQEKLEVPESTIGHVLSDFRAYRAAMRERGK